MKNFLFRFPLLISVFLVCGAVSFPAQALSDYVDLSKALIVYRADAKGNAEKNAPQVLAAEVAKRTGLTLATSPNWEKERPLIVITSQMPNSWGKPCPVAADKSAPENQPEGYRLVVTEAGKFPVVWVVAKESRATLFAVGELLRRAELGKGRFLLPSLTDIATAPAYPIRGHQLGYRDTDNCYDAWTVDQYDQYLLDMAFMGTNAIENTPFHDAEERVMKYRREDMNVYLSEVCDKYEIDYSLWVPFDMDLNDAAARKAFLETNRSLIDRCKRIDDIFVAGGDPGHNHPSLVLPMMEDLYKIAVKRFPHIRMWLSQQGYDSEKQEYVYNYLTTRQPKWLTGLVHGPQSPYVKEERDRLRAAGAHYQYRIYPDITHLVRCQFPIRWWDPALNLTLGREAPSLRLDYFHYVFNFYTPYGTGFITYSEGVHDDMNKMLWSALGWNPKQSIETVTRDYARLYFGSDLEQEMSDAMMALDRNWTGVLATNGSVTSTYRMWKEIEKNHPELKSNWRFQQYLLRAVYDYYVRERQKIETGLETEAKAILLTADRIGADSAARKALKVLKQVEGNRPMPEQRAQIVELCEALWHSMGVQTSVPKYGARNPERGAVLDFIDRPLNDRWWLEDQLALLQGMQNEADKVSHLRRLALWEEAGEGGYYNNIGHPAKSDNVVHGTMNYPHVFEETNPSDPEPGFWWRNEGADRNRLATISYLNSPVLFYPSLDPSSDYLFRCTGKGNLKIEIDGTVIAPTRTASSLDEQWEFPIDRSLLKKGEVTIRFSYPDESNLGWRDRSFVTESWLIKR